MFTKRSFDYETTGERNISCTLVATDNIHNSTANIVVHVQDINDNTPQFENPKYEMKINETVAIDTVLLTVSMYTTYIFNQN